MMFVLITFFAFSPRYHAYFREIFHLKKTIHLWELLKTGLPMGIMYCFELTLRTERVNKPCFLAPALQPDWLAQSTYI